MTDKNAGEVRRPWQSQRQRFSVEPPEQCDGAKCRPTLPHEFLPKRFPPPDEPEAGPWYYAPPIEMA